MTNLVPEQRLDKNGRFNTKHVRATPKARSATSNVPAPSLATAGKVKETKPAQKAFRPRVSQTRQERHTLNDLGNDFHPALKDLDRAGYSWGRNYLAFSFEASEVEVYDVLKVTTPDNAARLLGSGIRTADEAVEYLRTHGASDAIIDASALATEALQRGIKSDLFMTRGPEMLKEDSPYAMDALEARSITSIADQVPGQVEYSILAGKIKLADIKYIGAAKLKTHKRLRRSAVALSNANDPDWPYTLDDLKTLVERAATENSPSVEGEYYCALEHLMQVGPEAINDCESLALFRAINASHRSHPRDERYDRIAYESKLFGLFRQSGKNREGTELAMRLRDAGIPAEDAGRMLNEGMSERAIIAVINEGTEKPLAEGWL